MSEDPNALAVPNGEAGAALPTRNEDDAIVGASGPPRGSIALALGGGAAKGLAHIPVLEAFDELGLRPRVIAGCSIGALLGACYAAGMSAREIRAYAIELFEARTELVRRVFGSKTGAWGSLFSFNRPALIAPETLFGAVMPEQLPHSFADLKLPFLAVATDFHAQSEVVLSTGALLPAIGASSALPGLLTPVVIDGRVLIDGGFVNPTPFDICRGAAEFTVAVDVTGKLEEKAENRLPSTMETFIGGAQIMLHSLVNEKLRHTAPDLLIRPDITRFRVLDFYKVEEILVASASAKDETKRGIEALLAKT